MKRWLMAVLVAAGLIASPAAQASKASVGLVFSYPEILGLYGSLWPSEALSVDLRFTLSTLDAGVTGHILLVEDGPSMRHDLVVTAMGGWVHDVVANSTWHSFRGAHFLAAVGYGLQAGWDVRVLGGLAVNQAVAGWGAAPTAMLYAGHSF